MRPSRKSTALAAITVLGMASASQASPVYEPFDQATGVSATGSSPTGLYSTSDPDATGFSGNWIPGSSVSNSIVYPGLSSTLAPPAEGNAVQFNLSTKNTFDSETRTVTTAPSTGSVFVGVLINDPTTVGSTTDPVTLIKLLDSSGNPIVAFGFNRTFSQNDWALKLGTVTSTYATTTVAAGAASGTTLLIADLNYDSDTVSLYAGNSSASTLVSSNTLTTGSLATLAQIQMYAGVVNVTGADPNASTFDEIRVGTSLSDVTAPEPASLGLFGAIGVAGLLRRRRGRLVAE